MVSAPRKSGEPWISRFKWNVLKITFPETARESLSNMLKYLQWKGVGIFQVSTLEFPVIISPNSMLLEVSESPQLWQLSRLQWKCWENREGIRTHQGLGVWSPGSALGLPFSYLGGLRQVCASVYTPSNKMMGSIPDLEFRDSMDICIMYFWPE